MILRDLIIRNSRIRTDGYVTRAWFSADSRWTTSDMLSLRTQVFVHASDALVRIRTYTYVCWAVIRACGTCVARKVAQCCIANCITCTHIARIAHRSLALSLSTFHSSLPFLPLLLVSLSLSLVLFHCTRFFSRWTSFLLWFFASSILRHIAFPVLRSFSLRLLVLLRLTIFTILYESGKSICAFFYPFREKSSSSKNMHL